MLYEITHIYFKTTPQTAVGFTLKSKTPSPKQYTFDHINKFVIIKKEDDTVYRNNVNSNVFNLSEFIADCVNNIEALQLNTKESDIIKNYVHAIQNPLNQIIKSNEVWSTYRQSHMASDFRTSMTHLDNGITELAKIGVLSFELDFTKDFPNYPSLGLNGFYLAQGDFKKLEDKYIDSSNQTAQKIATNHQQTLSNIEQKRLDIESAQNRITSEINNLIAKTNNLETDIIKRLTSEDSELVESKNNFLKKLEEHLNTISKKQNIALAKIKQDQEDSDRLLDTIKQDLLALQELQQNNATDVMSGEFSKAAERAYESSSRWSIAFFTLGIITVGYLIASQLLAADAAFSITNLLGKLSTVAICVTLIVYSAKRSTLYRDHATYFERMGIEMKSLDAYLAPYDRETKLQIKAEMLASYFGKIASPQVELDTLTEVKTPLALLGDVAKVSSNNLANSRSKNSSSNDEEV